MDDQYIVRDMKHWPFKVSEKHGKPAITVKHKGEDRDFVSDMSIQNQVLISSVLVCRRDQHHGSRKNEGDR